MKVIITFTYLGSSVLFTENDINTWLEKAWTAIDRLSVIWKVKPGRFFKLRFFPKKRASQFCYMDAPLGRWHNDGEKVWWLLHTNAAICIIQVLEPTSYITAALRPLPPITKSIQVRRTRLVEHSWRSTHKWWTLEDPFTWTRKG